MIRLLARYMPLEHVRKVLLDDVYSNIIELGKTSAVRNRCGSSGGGRG